MGGWLTRREGDEIPEGELRDETRREPTLKELLSPRQVQLYLEAKGWERERASETFAVWKAHRAGVERQLFLPLLSDPPDFELRLRQFVDDLATVEAEDRDEVLDELQFSAADRVRVRIAGPRVGLGELPLVDGAYLFDGARSMMQAAACAALNSRASFGSKVPGQVADYIKEVRLGQTEPGSFVVTIISGLDLDSRNRHTIPTDDGGEFETPFERKVTTKLVKALQAASGAADSVLQYQADYEAFGEAVHLGVSANLCDAVAKMGAGNEGVDLRLSVDWAEVAPLPDDQQELTEDVVFRPESFPVMERARDYLRGVGPFPGVEVVGTVKQLRRSEAQDTGTVVLDGYAHDDRKTIHLELTGDAYLAAVDAHRNKQQMFVTGTLLKRGRKWMLDDPKLPVAD